MLEQKRKNPKHWFGKLRMSSKIMLSGAVMIFCSNFLILLVVCLVAVHSMKNQIQEQVQNQLTLTTSSVSGTINDIGKLMITMSTAQDISDFVCEASQNPSEYLLNLNGSNEKLRILKLSSSQIDYVALLRVDQKKPLFIGREIRTPQIYQRLLEDAELTRNEFHNGISMYLNQDLYADAELNLFCPIFPKFSLKNEPAAYLIVGINTSRLAESTWKENDSQSICVMNSEGQIILSDKTDEIGTRKSEYQKYTLSNGKYETADSVVMYQRSKVPDLIVEGTMDKNQWLSSILGTASSLALAIVIFTLVSIVVIYSLCNYFYEPMEEMLETMRSVGKGDIEKKMKPYEQSDFGQISETFNSMTDSLKEQMEMIRSKEQENTEIRLNALQSQIKPHFLYNTLESIHMQSLLEGATGASRMILALSRYYRLSLSKGAELIPLSLELEHMDNYVMIQNIRFDNILQMEKDIPAELLQFEIPKITLQPLVENAFYHGIKPKKTREGHISITGCLEEGYMILKISDDGIGMTEEQIQNLNENINVLINDGSYGVKNVHTRLEIRYGSGSGLYYEKNQEGGVTVTVRLPARKAS